MVPPSGWTKVIVTNAYSGGGYKDIGQAVYYKVAQTNEPESYTWMFAQKVEALGGITAFSGVDAAKPIKSYSGLGGYGDSTGKNMLNAPGINVSGQSKIIAFYGFKESAVLDVPFGMTMMYQKRDDDNDYTILAAEESVMSASQTGTRTSYSWEYDDPKEPVESK